MKLKGCLVSLGIFLIVVIVISFFLPRKMDTAVKHSMKASPEQIFAQVNNLTNWEHWSPWYEMDPRMDLTYSDNTAGEGASYTWSSKKKKVGSGTMSIDESIPHDKVGTVMQFEGFDNESYADFYISQNGSGGSDVTWDFKSDYKAKMPWSKFKVYFMKKALKKSYLKGLMTMDEYIMKHPNEHIEQAAANAKIEIREMPDINAVIAHRSGLISEMMSNGAAIFNGAIADATEQINEGNLKRAGQPFAIAHEWNQTEGTFKMDIGIPVESGGEVLKPGKMVVISYYGPHSGTGVAHEQVGKYINANELVVIGAPWEVYITDPTEEPNSAKWLTEVMYPIK